jgi:hypothetical protein
MMEAIGEPLPTAPLPLAFAQADLRSTAGWKPRVEAAERLARSGAIAPNRLLGVYTERLPAASGGVWDRVEAVQQFDVAVLSGDPVAVANALHPAWEQITRAGLEAPFAQLYGERLARIPLSGKVAALAFRIGLLSDGYEAIARAHTPQDGTEAFLKALAMGDLSQQRAAGQTAMAVQEAFADAPLAPAFAANLRDGNTGEAILKAIRLVGDGARGDVTDVTDGLALFRRVGLEEVARRAGLELMILERRG